MKREKPELPGNWLSDLRQSLASARAQLDEADELLGKAERHRDPGISSVQMAKRLYRVRRVRDRHFAADLFADPAWDILLDLYVAHHEGRAVTTSSACLASSVAQTTGLRWVNNLAEAGLIERSPSLEDHRLQLVSLTDEAVDRMSDLLIQIAFQFPFKRLTR